MGSNPIWNSEFLFPSFSVNAKFIMLYFYRKTHLAVITFVEVIGVPGSRIGFSTLLSKNSKVPIYYSPVA